MPRMTRAALARRNPRLAEQVEGAKRPAPDSVVIHIPMRAIPLERHRHGVGGSYLPARSRKFRQAVQAYMRQAMGCTAPFSGPLRAEFGFEFARPKTGPNAKAVFHAAKPDFDNLVKAICDAGNGILWHDDCQISSADVDKRWADEDAIYLVVATDPARGER